MNGYFKQALRSSMLWVMGVDGGHWKDQVVMNGYVMLTATVMNTNFRHVTVLYMCAPSESKKYIQIAIDRIKREYPWLFSGEYKYTLVFFSDRGTAIKVILSNIPNTVNKYCHYHLKQ
jgi:hypothetical protein